jgi:hypothetical protein
LKDIDKFVIPEDDPEKDVFLKMYDVIVNLRDSRSDLSAEQVMRVAMVLVMNIPTFRYILRPSELLATDPEPLRVNKEQTPIYIRQWPLDQTRIDAARKLLDELVKQGVVEPASSSWNAPIMIVPKKDGTWRRPCERVLQGVLECDAFWH